MSMKLELRKVQEEGTKLFCYFGFASACQFAATKLPTPVEACFQNDQRPVNVARRCRKAGNFVGPVRFGSTRQCARRGKAFTGPGRGHAGIATSGHSSAPGAS